MKFYTSEDKEHHEAGTGGANSGPMHLSEEVRHWHRGPTKVALCQFEGCTELTIFGMCGPHLKEMDKRFGEYLVKNGWTKVFGAGEDLKAVGAEEPSGPTANLDEGAKLRRNA